MLYLLEVCTIFFYFAANFFNKNITAVFEGETTKKAPEPVKAKTSDVTAKFRARGERCVVCEKLVYFSEKLIADELIYHKVCKFISQFSSPII